MKISVVIPVRNEAESIGQLMDGLLKQTRQPDEILITDGGSVDATPLIVEKYAQCNSTIRLFHESNALPGRGRNIGARSASHEWLAFIDAGVVPADDWLAQLADCATRDPDTDVVYGTWEPVTDTFFKECAAIAYAYVPNRENDEEVKHSRGIFSSLMRRSVWQVVGEFPEQLRSAEDHLFMSKIDEQGFRVKYAPLALVRWDMQPTFGLTFRRFVAYSRSNLAAGLWKEWHATILSRYVALTILALVWLSLWWTIFAMVLFLMMFVVRGIRALIRSRRSSPARLGRNLKRLVVLIPLLMTIDAATILGTVNWLVRDKFHFFKA